MVPSLYKLLNLIVLSKDVLYALRPVDLVVEQEDYKFFELPHVYGVSGDHVPEEENETTLPQFILGPLPALGHILLDLHQLYDMVHAVDPGNDPKASQQRNTRFQT